MAVTMDLTQHTLEVAETAGRAPSHHNAQPWALRVRPDAVHVRLDRTRAVPLADPDGRQMHLGVGAAIFAVRLRLAALGTDPVVALLPDPTDPDLAAMVRAGPPRSPSETEIALFGQIGRRRTVRELFVDEAMETTTRVELDGQTAKEGAQLRWLEQSGERRGVAALVATAERIQQANPAFRAELSRWVGRDATRRGEGIPHRSLGPSAAAGHAAAFPLRDFGAGRPRWADDRRPEVYPVVAVLSTPGDGRIDWLRGGQALMRLLLAASRRGVFASFLNQPLELPGLRAQVRDELRLDGFPQAILRMGVPAGPLPPATPRRKPTDLLL